MTVERIVRLGIVNAYLVEEDDGLTVIDTMLPGSAGAIRKAAGGREIRRIALTHAHGDHIGSLDALAAELPGAEVVISARDARLLAKDKTLDPDEPQAANESQAGSRASGANALRRRFMSRGA